MVRLGIVYEIHKNKAVVLTPDSEFLVIKRTKDMYLGQQVKFNIQDVKKTMRPVYKYVSVVSGIAAVFVLAFLYFRVPFYGAVYGYVNIDVNPSIELTVDKKLDVLEAKALNNDAKKITKGLNTRGKDAYSVINDILDKCKEYGYIAPEEDNVVLVSASLDESNWKESKENKEKELDKFLANIKEKINSEDKEYIIGKVIKVSPEYRKEAMKYNLSMGKFYLMERAKAVGIDLAAEDLDDEKISEILVAIEKRLDTVVENTVAKLENENSQEEQSTQEEQSNSTEETTEPVTTPEVQITQEPSENPTVDPNQFITSVPTIQPTVIPDVKPTDRKTTAPTPKVKNTPKPTPKVKNADNSTDEGDLKIRLKSVEKNPEPWIINSDFHVINNSDKDIDLKKVKVRYYFTREGRADLEANVYSFSKYRTKDDSFVKQENTNNVKVSFHKVSDSNMYMEIEFKSGTLKKGEYLYINITFNNVKWDQMKQYNDYSYIPDCDEFKVTERVTAYISDKLVWGVEPY